MELTRLKSILDKVAPSYHLTYEPSDVSELKRQSSYFLELAVASIPIPTIRAT